MDSNLSTSYLFHLPSTAQHFSYLVSHLIPMMSLHVAGFIMSLLDYTRSDPPADLSSSLSTSVVMVSSFSLICIADQTLTSPGGAPVRAWIFRAYAIQGTQQIYVVGLWYWGSILTAYSTTGGSRSALITSTPIMTAICLPITALLFAVGIVLHYGLPTYYRQEPGQVPSFYSALLRRKIVLWFFVMVVLQNYWLSTPYGRNWRYLFSSAHAPTWAIFAVIIFFFIFVWALVLWTLGRLTRQHSWVLPIFAIGLGAPRWCQMLWGTSNIGLYIPWAGPIGGAVLGRSLWAWLGVLDAVQGVGFGMILLQTLTRVHIACTLVVAQVVGSIATIAARASAPDSTGPGSVFPDFSIGWMDGLRQPWFWVGWLCQVFICAGFFAFFRKEQLSKP